MHVCQIFFDVRYWVSDGDGEGGGGGSVTREKGTGAAKCPQSEIQHTFARSGRETEFSIHQTTNTEGQRVPTVCIIHGYTSRHP